MPVESSPYSRCLLPSINSDHTRNRRPSMHSLEPLKTIETLHKFPDHQFSADKQIHLDQSSLNSLRFRTHMKHTENHFLDNLPYINPSSIERSKSYWVNRHSFDTLKAQVSNDVEKLRRNTFENVADGNRNSAIGISRSAAKFSSSKLTNPTLLSLLRNKPKSNILQAS